MVIISYFSNCVLILLNAPFMFKNWIYFFLSRFGREEGILYLRNGCKFKFRVRKGDRAAINEVFLLHSYGMRTRKFAIGEEDIVLDIGAHIGSFTIYAARKCKNGRIYAVEPVKDNFDLLCENIRLNNLSNVIPINAALGASETQKQIFLNDLITASLVWQSTGKTEWVKVITLDTLFNDHHLDRIDFLKMDCEGSEFDILMNANKETIGKIFRIALEFHNIGPSKNAVALSNFLRELGFQVQTTDVNRWNGLLLANR